MIEPRKRRRMTRAMFGQRATFYEWIAYIGSLVLWGLCFLVSSGFFLYFGFRTLNGLVHSEFSGRGVLEDLFSALVLLTILGFWSYFSVRMLLDARREFLEIQDD